MESVRRANNRLRNYPIYLAKCSQTAGVYAACVTRDLNVERGICEKEFVAFKQCVQKAASEMKVRL